MFRLPEVNGNNVFFFSFRIGDHADALRKSPFYVRLHTGKRATEAKPFNLAAVAG